MLDFSQKALFGYLNSLNFKRSNQVSLMSVFAADVSLSNDELELFVPGRICLLGEHSDWAGGHRAANNDLVEGYCMVLFSLIFHSIQV